MSFAQPRTMRTISAVASGVPSPKFVGSTLLRSCSITQLSANLSRPLSVQWGEVCVGRAVAHAAQVQVSSVRSLVGNRGRRPVSLSGVGPLTEARCLSSRVAQLVLPRSDLWPRCQRCANHWDPVRNASTTPLAIRFTNFAGGGENFDAACLIAAHCIFIRTMSCSSVSTATSECTSAAVCMFCGCAHAGLQYLQGSPDVTRVHLV